jgi:hypothetical protein
MTTARLRLGRRGVVISSHDAPEVVAAAAAAWAAFAVPATAPRAGRLEVARRPVGFAIRDERGHESRAASPELAWLGLDVLLRRGCLDGAGALLVHAAALARPGRGALLALGPSTSGKSCLAVALAAAGWRFCGDEVAGLDARRRVVAFPRLPEVGPMAAALARRWRAVGRVRAGGHLTGYLRLPPRRRARPGERQPLRLIVVLERRRGRAPVTVAPLGAAATARHLLGAALNAHVRGPAAVALVTRIAARTPGVRLVYHDVLTQGAELSRRLAALV